MTLSALFTERTDYLPSGTVCLRLAIGTLTALHLLLIWGFTYVPSQDGPSHIGTVATLKALSEGNSYLAVFFTPNWQWSSNQLYHGLLFILSHLMPMLLAEKLILSLYVVGFVAGFRYLIRSVGGRPGAVLLAFPIVFCQIFYMGFFNSCLAFVVALFSLGEAIRYLATPSSKRLLLLAGLLYLTYLAHVFVGLILMGAIALLVALHWLNHWLVWRFSSHTAGEPISHCKPGMLLALATLPTALATLAFLASTDVSSHEKTPSLLEGVASVIRYDGLQLVEKVDHALHTLGTVDGLFKACWYLLLIGLSLTTIRSMRQLQRWRLTQPVMMLICFVSCLSLWIVFPINSGPIVMLDDRLMPFVATTWVVWLSVASTPYRLWSIALLASFLISTLTVLYSLPIHAAMNQDIAEYTAIAGVIEPESSVVPVAIKPRSLNAQGYQAKMHRVDYTGGLTGYLVEPLRVANVRNYQLGYPYFPLRYADGVSMKIRKAFWKDTAFLLEPADFSTQSHPHIDYLVVWSEPDYADYQTHSGALLDYTERNDYQEIHRSQPSGRMRVFRKTDKP